MINCLRVVGTHYGGIDMRHLALEYLGSCVDENEKKTISPYGHISLILIAKGFLMSNISMIDKFT